MSRSIFLPALALAVLTACAPAPAAMPTSGASPGGTGTSPQPATTSSGAPSTSPGAAASPVATSPAASTFSAKVSVNGKALSINPNSESPLPLVDSSTSVRWAFGINKQGGPADQAAIVLTFTGKPGTNLADAKTSDISLFKLQIVQNGDPNTSWTIGGPLGDDIQATITNSLLDIHMKGPSLVTKAQIDFEATGVRFR